MFHGGAAIDYNGKHAERAAPATSGRSCSSIRPSAAATRRRSTSRRRARREYERYTIEPDLRHRRPDHPEQGVVLLRLQQRRSSTRTGRSSGRTRSSGGVTYPSIQTFNAKTTDKRYLYNAHVQTSGRTCGCASTATTSARRGRGSALPGIDTATFRVDEDGNTIARASATSNAGDVQSALADPHGDGYNNSYSGVVDWNRRQQDVREHHGRLPGRRLGQHGRRLLPRHPPHVQRLEHQLPGRAARPAARRAATPTTRRTRFTVKDNYSRFNVERRPDALRELARPARVQDGRAVRAHRQRREPGRSSSRTCRSSGTRRGRRSTSGRCAAPTATTRSCSSYTVGDDPLEQHRRCSCRISGRSTRS